MISSRHRSHFTALGLVAMLLMALLPTIGRMAGVQEHVHPGAVASMPASHGGDVAMHAAMQHEGMQHDGMQHDGMQHDGMQHDGMQHAAMPGMHHAMPSSPSPSPAAPARSPHDGDCDYCPLLASLASLAIPALPPAPGGVAIPPQPAPIVLATHDIVVPGLGARGPPRIS